MLIAVSGEWLPVEVVMFDHSNCVERAFCFALPASSAGIDITDHARLYPSNWFETEKMERARRDAPAAPGAASQINLWQQIKTFDWHLAIWIIGAVWYSRFQFPALTAKELKGPVKGDEYFFAPIALAAGCPRMSSERRVGTAHAAEPGESIRVV